MEIVRLLRPLWYKVSLVEGALVRRSVELASNEIKRVSYGEIVEVNRYILCVCVSNDVMIPQKIAVDSLAQMVVVVMSEHFLTLCSCGASEMNFNGHVRA